MFFIAVGQGWEKYVIQEIILWGLLVLTEIPTKSLRLCIHCFWYDLSKKPKRQYRNRF